MIQYISKDALLTEIENLLDKGKYHDDYDCAYRDGNNGALYALEGRIDTIEVKEVDLEKEVDDFVAKEWEGIEEDTHFYNMIKNELFDIAKHFVEIGINLQKDNELTWEDISKIREIFCGMVGYPLISDKEECTEVLERYKAQKRK